LFGIAAGAKFENYGHLGKVKERNCDSILAYDSGVAVARGGATPDGSPGPGGGGGGGPLAPVATSGGNGGNSARSGQGAAIASDLDNTPFPQGKYAAALAGPAGTLLSSLNNKEKLPEALKQLAGVSMGDLARTMSSGQSPAAIMAGAGGGLSTFASDIKSLGDAVRDGKLAMNGLSAASTYAGGAGGGKGAGGAKPGLGLGFNFGGATAAAVGDQKFEKTAKAIEPAREGDIWHEGYGGSIFQLVSQKLVTNRDRIDQLEWDTPLNRALAGLKPQKKR
jgi:hypothetical protein